MFGDPAVAAETIAATSVLMQGLGQVVMLAILVLAVGTGIAGWEYIRSQPAFRNAPHVKRMMRRPR